ncbi:MAG TPA: selenide, water dikinase SelD [Pusillimonas sp.]|nr:selenide, water dikinase SelD [Pusillimonas sp.]
MQQTSSPVMRDIVLVGGGHSHAIVLRKFAMKPMPGVRLTVICTDTETPYSGMLPGYIAGHYTYDDIHIDVRKLAEFAGARYFKDEVTGVDRDTKRVLCRNRPPVPYDILSINVGATPQVDAVPGAKTFSIPVKPIRYFNARWLALLDRMKERTQPTIIAVVGAGAGGVELALAIQYRLQDEMIRQEHQNQTLQFHLFSADPVILPTHNTRVRAAFMRTLAARNITVHLCAKVTRLEQDCLHTENGDTFTAHETFWVTQATGPDWLRETGLALDENHFIKVSETLQTETDPLIFAAGDCVAFTPRPLEKAGVFAVRMGTPLTHNLRRALEQNPLLPYRPQQKWLALISTGDPHAIASRGSLYAKGNWIWRWKNQIDRRFMRKLNEPAPTMPREAKPTQTRLSLNPDEQVQAISATAMRCGGCGAKVGASILSRALATIEPINRPEVLIGLHTPDDAAVVKVPPGKAMVHTVDFFRAFIDDPYLFGRIAANHALGDIFAMGGEAVSATAIATVPPGLEEKVADTLFQMMKGAIEVLNDAGCALVGGHTGEGQELALGFAVNGVINESLEGILTKNGMRPGDVLILTKPIGTGTLFAAHAQLKAKGRWIDNALDYMQISNRLAVPCLIEHGTTACTDITGFGLLGHLVEMTTPSGVHAELNLNALPVLEGAAETAAMGILSSLQPANVRLRRALQNQETTTAHLNYPLIFDPQTAGGLLASVPAPQADAAIAALKTLGYPATKIGRIVKPDNTLAPVRLII